MSEKVRLIVNGREHFLEEGVTLERSLLHYLREELKFKDVKCGCNKGFCGSCTVIVNGVPRRSCITRLKALRDAVIETPSSLGGPALSRYASLLHRHGAVQCGFCFPGMVCSLESRLKEKNSPSREETLEALSGHICRCTGYLPIVESICNPDKETPSCHGIGGSASIREDSEAKLKGKALYADDLEMPGMLHVFVLRSSFPHAFVKSVVPSKAERLEGVVRIIIAKDLPGSKTFGIIQQDQPVLAFDKVRFRGDAIAIVVAESRQIAENAAKLIEVEYEPLPPVHEVDFALSKEAPLIHERGNVFTRITLGSESKPSDYAGENFVSISGHFKTSGVDHAYMEPECSVSVYNEKDGSLTIHSGSQNIHADQEELAHILGIPKERIEVRLPFIGGGFGGKEDLTTQPYSALSALMTSRPCKYRFTREESLLCSTKKHPFDIRITISADRQGKLGAISVNAISDIGPYASLSQVVLTRFATHILGPYTWMAHQIDITGVYTNNLIAGAMRGFGVNQACFAIEAMMDRMARVLGISPVRLREINMIRDGQKMGLGETAQHSAGLEKCFREVVARISREEIEAFNASHEKTKRGFGMALAYKNMGLGNNSPRDHASVKISILPKERKLVVWTASCELGQGIYATLKRIAMESSGLGEKEIVLECGKTTGIPPAGVTSASRQTFMSGNAVFMGIKEFYRHLALLISKRYGMKETPVQVFGEEIRWPQNRREAHLPSTLWEFASQETDEISMVYRYDAPPTKELEKAGSPEFRSHFGYSYAAHGILVEADLETKKFKIIKIVAAHDVGKALNPQGLIGQIVGGTVMGLGYAISERLEVENGAPAPSGFSGLGLLKAKDIPEIVPLVIEEPHPLAPYGARGIGEISTVPVAAALCNALNEATGLDFNTLPIHGNEHGYRYIS